MGKNDIVKQIQDMKGPLPFRVCEFCKSRTNLKIRACCQAGNQADLDTSKSAESLMREIQVTTVTTEAAKPATVGDLLRSLQREIHAVNHQKGWYEEQRSFGDYIALAHSELSEALESYRSGEAASFMLSKKPEGWGIELADTVIRLLDMAEYYNLDLEQLIRVKIEYNKTRPHRHGGKKL
jgi:NTP pyrophosphatase (non-canonical NTP hydrolase)